jgi:hypothetical protein
MAYIARVATGQPIFLSARRNDNPALSLADADGTGTGTFASL